MTWLRRGRDGVVEEPRSKLVGEREGRECEERRERKESLRNLSNGTVVSLGRPRVSGLREELATHLKAVQPALYRVVKEKPE